MERKKIRIIIFFSYFWFRENHKEKNMGKNWVEKLLETSDKIFLIKL